MLVVVVVVVAVVIVVVVIVVDLLWQLDDMAGEWSSLDASRF